MVLFIGIVTARECISNRQIHRLYRNFEINELQKKMDETNRAQETARADLIEQLHTQQKANEAVKKSKETVDAQVAESSRNNAALEEEAEKLRADKKDLQRRIESAEKETVFHDFTTEINSALIGI